jgi:hypothetical protein
LIASKWGWWSTWIARSPELARVAIATVVATLLFGGAGLRNELVWHMEVRAERRQQPWIPLLAHLTEFQPEPHHAETFCDTD